MSFENKAAHVFRKANKKRIATTGYCEKCMNKVLFKSVDGKHFICVVCTLPLPKKFDVLPWQVMKRGGRHNAKD